MAHPLVLPPMHVLARPLDNPALHRWLEETRTKTGNSVIYRRGAVRRVLRALIRSSRYMREAHAGVAAVEQHTVLLGVGLFELRRSGDLR